MSLLRSQGMAPIVHEAPPPPSGGVSGTPSRLSFLRTIFAGACSASATCECVTWTSSYSSATVPRSRTSNASPLPNTECSLCQGNGLSWAPEPEELQRYGPPTVLRFDGDLESLRARPAQRALSPPAHATPFRALFSRYGRLQPSETGLVHALGPADALRGTPAVEDKTKILEWYMRLGSLPWEPGPQLLRPPELLGGGRDSAFHAAPPLSRCFCHFVSTPRFELGSASSPPVLYHMRTDFADISDKRLARHFPSATLARATT